MENADERSNMVESSGAEDQVAGKFGIESGKEREMALGVNEGGTGERPGMPEVENKDEEGGRPDSEGGDRLGNLNRDFIGSTSRFGQPMFTPDARRGNVWGRDQAARDPSQRDQGSMGSRAGTPFLSPVDRRGRTQEVEWRIRHLRTRRSGDPG